MAYDSEPNPQVKILTFAFSESEMFWEKAMVLSSIESVKSSFLVIPYFVSSFRFQVSGFWHADETGSPRRIAGFSGFFQHIDTLD